MHQQGVRIPDRSPAASETLRHRLKDQGNLPLIGLPLVLLGLASTVRRTRASPAHRVILVAVVAAPFTSALVALHQQRVMGLIVPAGLLVCVGLEQVVRAVGSRPAGTVVAAACAALLSIQGVWMTATALTQGPRWTSNYSLYGLQYGPAQVFAAVNHELALGPTRRCFVSFNWANNVESFIPFFVPRDSRDRVAIFSVDDAAREKTPLDLTALYVLAWDEFDRARASAKFVIDPLGVIRFPDGKPGFYLVRLRYAPGIDEILAAERLERRLLDEAIVEVEGQKVTLYHSRFDLGSADRLFDGDVNTVARGEEANPIVLEMLFPIPRPIRRIGLDVWLRDFTVVVHLTQAGSNTPVDRERTYHHGDGLAHVDIDLPETTAMVSRLTLQICDNAELAPVHIHVAEIRLH